MPYIACPEIDLLVNANIRDPLPIAWREIYDEPIAFILPTGSLRIGGDSPNGLVLVNSAPAARVIRLLDMKTGQLIRETISANDGTYSFGEIGTRPDGYAVWFVGNVGERGLIFPGVNPG